MNNARTIVIAGFVFLIFSLLMLKLYSIQISNHEHYKFLADRQQHKVNELKAERGSILDCDGNLLAYSKEGVSYFADTRMLNEREKDLIISRFSALFNKPKEFYKKILESKKGNVCLERKAPVEIALKLNNFSVDGLYSKKENLRVYPYGNLAAHVLGYVNSNSEGVAGIEKSFNDVLKGRDGNLYIERDVKGRTVAVDEEASVLANDGMNVQLTIKKSFQKIVGDELEKGVRKYKGKSGVAILVNPQNGEILALANYPDYNPAKIKKTDDPSSRRNRAVTDTYEPGSTMKSIVMATLLEEKLVQPYETINTENGKFKFHGILISDDHKYSNLTVAEVLEHSSNIGMAKLSERIDNKTIYKYLRDFGFGNPTNIDFPSESNGKLKIPSSFSKVTKSSFSRGYGLAVTPIQMVAAYSALINGGKYFEPHIVKSISDKNGNTVKKFDKQFIRQIISAETSEKIKNMLMGVVENGTGRLAGLSNITVGGKTGTAKKIINNKYSNQYNSSFIGFFPVENPKALCYILIESPQIGKYGGSSAAPIFKNIAEKIVELDEEIVPDRENIPRQDELFENVIADLSNDDTGYTLNANIEEKQSREKIEIHYNKMPNLLNKSMREVAGILNNAGVDFKIEGSGKVYYQSIKPGIKIKNRMLCIVKCKPKKPKGLRLN